VVSSLERGDFGMKESHLSARELADYSSLITRSCWHGTLRDPQRNDLKDLCARGEEPS
jgi:hypothetical protein